MRRVARLLDRTEAQRVEQGDRPRAHREDVADDAADAGRRALVRLDERRMVVRLDLEHRREAVADVDGAGVLAGPLQHARGLRSAASSGARASSCSCSARTTSPRTARARSGSARGPSSSTIRAYSSRRDAVPLERRGVEGRFVRAALARHVTLFDRLCTTDSNSTRPSALPTAVSHARSGCGIRPTTFRASLQIPAMFSSDPFGFAASVGSPNAFAYRNTIRPAASSSRERLGRRVVIAFAVRDRHAQDLPARQRLVNGVSVCSTRMATYSQ